MKIAPAFSFPTLLILLTTATIHEESDSTLLKLEKEIDLPGVEGRIDYFSGGCPRPKGFSFTRGRINIHDLWVSQAVCSTLLRPWSGAVRASHYSSLPS